MHTTQYIPCWIRRGGFSSERLFEIPLMNSDVLVGTANVQYLLDEAKFVQCRIIAEKSDAILVEVPSSDVIKVSSNELVTLSD